MARNVIVATFDTRYQAYDTASDIDRLSDDIVDVMRGPSSRRMRWAT